MTGCWPLTETAYSGLGIGNVRRAWTEYGVPASRRSSRSTMSESGKSLSAGQNERRRRILASNCAWSPGRTRFPTLLSAKKRPSSARSSWLSVFTCSTIFCNVTVMHSVYLCHPPFASRCFRWGGGQTPSIFQNLQLSRSEKTATQPIAWGGCTPLEQSLNSKG